MDNWLQVRDENKDELDYIKDNSAINRGHTVQCGFASLLSAAGNFHVSLEPRSVMRLSSGTSSAGDEGSIGFAASMAKAMSRDAV